DEARRLMPLPSPEELQLKQDRLYADLGERLNSGAESWQALRTDPAKIAAALPAGAVLLDFVAYQAYKPNLGRPVPSYGAVVITRDAPPQWIPLGPAEPLDAEVRNMQELVRKRVRDIHIAAALQALHRRLWAPLERAIPQGASRVIISPDGEINFVSFPTLLDAHQEFLADRFVFEHVATARDVLTASALTAEPVAKPRILVLAYPDYAARIDNSNSAGSTSQTSNSGTSPASTATGKVRDAASANPAGGAVGPRTSGIPTSLPFRSTTSSNGAKPGHSPAPAASSPLVPVIRQLPVVAAGQGDGSAGNVTRPPLHSGGGGNIGETSPTASSVPGTRGLNHALSEWMEESLKPLTGTLREAEYLRDAAPRWGMRADVRTGAEATEACLHQGPPPYILHMATHGLFLPDPSAASPVAAQLPDSPGQPIAVSSTSTRVLSPQATAPPGIQPRNPMQRSLLALAGAGYGFDSWQRGAPLIGENDGILTAQELAELNLRGTWLVVLSACDTGIGMAQGGEGVLGLRRGFHLAGARYLLVTLWPVSDDDTVDFIKAFYDEALKTKTPPIALAEVQRKLLKKLRQERGLLEAVRSAGGFMLSY
ncbi:MAG TPA: CHAT domain-containing protein, partial [Candidatus Methylacidiphilales bacterium]|nr:CHAT domain-containing protein [Candidatus Methylacidiphilales bacterium]